MAKVNVTVLDAVVDGSGKGSKLTIDERSADYLARLGYVQIDKQLAQSGSGEKGTSAPKKSAHRKRKGTKKESNN